MRANRAVLQRLTLPLVLAACAAVALLLPAPVRSAEFPPEKFENLQLLPKDIGTRQLLDSMKAFSQSLGVRCWFCHVGEEGQDLSTFDFVTDELSHKVVAREMIKMTQQIQSQNMKEVAKLFRNLEGKTDAAPRVTCNTCHRGQTEPEK